MPWPNVLPALRSMVNWRETDNVLHLLEDEPKPIASSLPGITAALAPPPPLVGLNVNATPLGVLIIAVPDIRKLPVTSNFSAGVVVLIPTLPSFLTNNKEVPAELV